MISVTALRCGELGSINGELQMLPGDKSDGIEAHGLIPCAIAGSFHRTVSPSHRHPASYSFRCQMDELDRRMLDSKPSFVSWRSLCL